jgi:predicted enzyme involved in methoxymalonyl-ACP biosynthesis
LVPPNYIKYEGENVDPSFLRMMLQREFNDKENERRAEREREEEKRKKEEYEAFLRNEEARKKRYAEWQRK